MKLLQDFGVTALFGTLIIIGVFVLLIMGVYTGAASINDLLPMLGAWISAIVAAYFTIKARKS